MHITILLIAISSEGIKVLEFVDLHIETAAIEVAPSHLKYQYNHEKNRVGSKQLCYHKSVENDLECFL